jgi:hypothetical protein
MSKGMVATKRRFQVGREPAQPLHLHGMRRLFGPFRDEEALLSPPDKDRKSLFRKQSGTADLTKTLRRALNERSISITLEDEMVGDAAQGHELYIGGNEPLESCGEVRH